MKKRERRTERKTKPKIGRPRGAANKDGDGVVRLETIAFRVSAAERETIESKAEAADVGVGWYVRESLRKAGVLPKRPS